MEEHLSFLSSVDNSQSIHIPSSTACRMYPNLLQNTFSPTSDKTLFFVLSHLSSAVSSFSCFLVHTASFILNLFEMCLWHSHGYVLVFSLVYHQIHFSALIFSLQDSNFSFDFPSSTQCSFWFLIAKLVSSGHFKNVNLDHHFLILAGCALNPHF